MKNWQTLKLGSFLKRHYDSVQIEDFVKYKRITIKTKGQGIDIRDEVDGVEIGTKNQFKVKTNQFLLSKIDAMNGAFGIVPEQCNDGIITGNFWAYDIDENFILKDYLSLLSIQQVFTKFSIAASEGTTNRKYLREAKFLELDINIPQIDEQKKIIQKIEIASTKLNEINSLRDVQEIEMRNLRYSLMCSLENEYSKERIDVVCDLRKGTFPIMKTDAGEYPFVVTAAEFKTANNFDFDCEATCVPLVSSTGHGNAAMHRVHYASGKFALSNLLCAVMPKDKEIVNAKYLYELFMAKKDEYFVPIMAGTSNVSLNPGKLGAVEIPIPPIEEQNRIVELLEKINEIKQTHKEQEAVLKQLMPSLLDKAFKGEL